MHITPEQLGNGMRRLGHPWTWPEPQGPWLARQLAAAPTLAAPHSTGRQRRFPGAKHNRAALTACPAGPDAGERIRAEAAILLGHSLDMGPQETTRPKQHLEFVSYSDATGRVLSCPHTPSVLTFPVCPVKQIFWQGYRVTYYPCITISNPLIYLLFIYFSIIHLFTGNLEATKKALLVILL